jgi:hypothetical protein
MNLVSDYLFYVENSFEMKRIADYNKITILLNKSFETLKLENNNKLSKTVREVNSISPISLYKTNINTSQRECSTFDYSTPVKIKKY